MISLAFFIILIICLFILTYQKASCIVATLSIGIWLLFFCFFSHAFIIVKSIFMILFVLMAIGLNVPVIRKKILSKLALQFYQKVIPKISQTEQEALDAGTVEWDGELFSGNPCWETLFTLPKPTLTAQEQVFMEGPVKQLCAMLDSWRINHYDVDLPEAVWQFIRCKGFFGLIIPKKYGGQAFSAYAHSQVISKIASVNPAAAVTVSVPNSLGPAELLLHYGTEAQKSYYLPRLAKGEDVPCFALTAPEAGSDAGAIADIGVVCQGQYQGKEVTGILLNFNKRYITLAPVATIIGLAFKLKDPSHLLGEKVDLGITCALIPREIPGINIGRRHWPNRVAIQNGPITGKDVFIPLEMIIGGPECAGAGWRMLMDCLSCGRGISLPSLSVGITSAVAAATTAYSMIRKQFNLPIVKFGGVEEAISQIVGFHYIADATERLTVSIMGNGGKPAILSGITKYHTTELGRKVVLNGMDIHGGKAICMGPANYMSQFFYTMPIAITVEGANILTRSLIIFGQGAIRCHPYLLQEIQAAKEADPDKSLTDFDQALFGHVGYLLRNYVNTFVSGLFHRRQVKAPNDKISHYVNQLTHFSRCFATLADVSLILYGSRLKFKELISARLGDILSMLYMGSAVLKKYHDDQYPEEDFPLVAWCCEYLLHTAQTQILSVLDNYANRWVALLLRISLFPRGKTTHYPSDKLGQQVSHGIIGSTQMRQRLFQSGYLEPTDCHPIGKMEEIFNQLMTLQPEIDLVKNAVKNGLIEATDYGQQLRSAVEKSIIQDHQAEQLAVLDKQCRELIAVDDFSIEALLPSQS